jgi:hypothetical protein
MTSTIKVNTIQDSCGSALVTKCGSNITLGASGKNVIIACGATTVGMGRTGTVDWCTTAKTSPFTAVNGKGYFINTSGGAVTVTLPSSPTAGDILAFQDLNRTFATNKVTLCRNSSKIKGACANFDLQNNGQATTIIYSGATQGWVNIGDANITDGTALVSEYNIQYLVIAGGGGGASSEGGVGHGGGGAGGYRTITSKTFTVSTGTSYPITVGGGGASPANTPSNTQASACNGSNSVFSTITSTGGGGGALGFPSPSSPPQGVGNPGGSGGGGGKCASSGQNGRAGGTGNTPPVSPSQGNDGGPGGNSPSNNAPGGGGGGAGGAGTSGTPGGGNGGVGSANTIFGSSPIAPSYGVAPNPSNTGPGQYFAGGGGGGWYANGAGGYGGGGAAPSNAGTSNTGGGGGARTSPGGAAGGAGGSGIVVIRHVTSDGGSGGNATGTDGSDTVRVFTSDGTFTA